MKTKTVVVDSVKLSNIYKIKDFDMDKEIIVNKFPGNFKDATSFKNYYDMLAELSLNKLDMDITKITETDKYYLVEIDNFYHKGGMMLIEYPKNKTPKLIRKDENSILYEVSEIKNIPSIIENFDKEKEITVVQFPCISYWSILRFKNYQELYDAYENNKTESYIHQVICTDNGYFIEIFDFGFKGAVTTIINKEEK